MSDAGRGGGHGAACSYLRSLRFHDGSQNLYMGTWLQFHQLYFQNTTEFQKTTIEFHPSGKSYFQITKGFYEIMVGEIVANPHMENG